jgi:GNAT superfamily N-acetyltransferase
MRRAVTQPDSPYTIRQATEADLPALAAIKPPVALHRDRLRDADGTGMRYLVVETEGEVIGFGLLVFERPATWPDADDTTRLPDLVDLHIRQDRRSRGAGSALIAQMEAMVRARGGTRVYLSVDPVDNPRAHALYRRRGYTPLQTEPYRVRWAFTDSDGKRHAWEGWNLDMVKVLDE